MTKSEMFELMNKTLSMHLATVEDDQPHVRGMLLFSADEKGLVFHTASSKDVFKQIEKNPKAEVCFFANGVQLRVKGILVRDDNPELREKIYAHPTRKFLQAWKELGVDNLLSVFRLVHCKATTWTMESNFAEKEWIDLTE